MMKTLKTTRFPMCLDTWPLLEASYICLEGFIEGAFEGCVEGFVKGVVEGLVESFVKGYVEQISTFRVFRFSGSKCYAKIIFNICMYIYTYTCWEITSSKFKLG